MKLENQVCTLEQARRLKELGVEQRSLFTYCVVMPDPTGEKYYSTILYQSEDEHQLNAPIEVIASAFTVAELGVMLTAKSTHGRSTVGIDALPEYTEKNGWYWWPSLSSNILDPNYLVQLSADTQAKIYAYVLIYRLENNLTTAEEVNQRLQTA